MPNYICDMNMIDKTNRPVDEQKIRGVIGQVARIRERANKFIETELRKKGLDGIVPAHGGIFIYLFNSPDAVPTKELVDYVKKSKSTVTGMINTLEKHGYVRRLSSKSDSRVTLVVLTNKGKSIEQEFMEIARKLNLLVFGEMPDSQQEELERLLNIVERNLNDEI